MSETKTDAQILRDAAAHIRKVGKTSGIYFGQIDEDGHWPIFDADFKAEEQPCCALGAISVASGRLAEDIDYGFQAVWVFHDHVRLAALLGVDFVPSWSDSLPDTPEGAETVAKALEAAADQLEAS